MTTRLSDSPGRFARAVGELDRSKRAALGRLDRPLGSIPAQEFVGGASPSR